jgi:DNA polymerase III epsilon subunit-like protein
MSADRQLTLPQRTQSLQRGSRKVRAKSRPVRVHRYYPGLRSYSLGNLCAHYGIEFERHHRAMCDAEASARLLDLSLMATPPCTALARGIPRLRPRTLAI